jgi:uncharacterized membrane protein YuzA (DUF378 family)
MKKEMIEKFAALVTAAFGLVAALAWNDTIKAIFAQVFGEQSTMVAMIVYAVVVTIIAVVVVYFVGRAEAHAKDRYEAEEKKE